jgi:hypothetical protein
MEEKRQDYRVNKYVPCQCSWKGQVFNGVTENISYGGARVAHPVLTQDWQPPQGTEVKVTLFAESEEVLYLKGRVAHSGFEQSSGVRTGLEFDGTLDHAKYCLYFTSAG